MIRKPTAEPMADAVVPQQSSPAAPLGEQLPTTGGSFVREADGSLTRVEGPAIEKREA